MAPSQRNGTGGSALALREQYGGGRLLLTDSRVALLFCDEARHRALERAFGLSRDQANLATFVALLALAQAAQDGIQRMMRPGATPTIGDAMVGAAVVRELLSAVAGPRSRDAPLVGSLLTIAFLGAGARYVTQRTGHAVRSGTQRADAGFRQRYGYLVDPGHWRQRRFERRVAAAKERPG